MTSTTARPAELTGRVVRPGDGDYPVARAGWNQFFVHKPRVIVFAQETRDVVNALAWARQHGVALRVRSGGHCLEGWSNVDDGIVIDVSEMKSATIDSASHTATVGAGLNQLEAVTALGKAGFAAPTGTEGSVGLVGATLGGGFGLLTRRFGMASDNLLAAEIVVASGTDGAEVIVADEANNTDLLWALRGAGNGNFGIVTSLTYAIHPLAQTVYVTASWSGLGDLPEVFDAWQRSAPYVDDRLTSQLEIRRGEIQLIGVLVAGSEAEASQLLAPDPVGRPSRRLDEGGGLGRHLRGLPDPDPRRARELEVQLAVHLRALLRRSHRARRCVHGEGPHGGLQLLHQCLRWRREKQRTAGRIGVRAPRRALLRRTGCRLGTASWTRPGPGTRRGRSADAAVPVLARRVR